MCKIIPFPVCFHFITVESAECELHLASCQLQEARDREIYEGNALQFNYHNVAWYHAALERFHEAERWVILAHAEKEEQG